MSKRKVVQQRFKGGRLRIVAPLLWALVVGPGMGGCKEGGENKAGATFKTEWSSAKPSEPSEEGSPKRGGGSVLGIFRGGGEPLWRKACAHAIDVMFKAALKAMPDDKSRDKAKADMERMFEDASRECLNEFKKANEDAADDAARCMLEITDQRGLETCAEMLTAPEMKGEKWEEKKEEKK